MKLINKFMVLASLILVYGLAQASCISPSRLTIDNRTSQSIWVQTDVSCACMEGGNRTISSNTGVSNIINQINRTSACAFKNPYVWHHIYDCKKNICNKTEEIVAVTWMVKQNGTVVWKQDMHSGNFKSDLTLSNSNKDAKVIICPITAKCP